MENLIYILGAGRSGTTLLGILLNNSKDITHYGELNRYFDLDGVPRASKEYENQEVPKFWSEVKEILNSQYSSHQLCELGCLSRKYESHKYFVTNFLRLFGKRDFKKYSKFKRLLLANLHSKSNFKVVVDSSKYPNCLLSLNRILHPKVIYIVRNPESVINAFLKENLEQPSKTIFSAALYYFIINCFCSIVYYFKVPAKNRIRIKYEDLIVNPEKTLNQIQEKFNVDLVEVIDKIKKNSELKTGFELDGNRIRLNRHIKLKRKTKVLKKRISGIKGFLVLLNTIWYR